MEIQYASEKVRLQCTSLKEAKKLFGGNKILAESLLARINAINNAEILKDIIVQPQFHFHKLEQKRRRKLEGYFAIDVKTRKEPWRIILQPLDENKQEYTSCNIDKIAEKVKIVEITEVSSHYE